MYKYHCLNPISPVGLEKFSSEYQETDNIQEADVVLVRSADMKSMDLPENLKAIGRESWCSIRLAPTQTA